MCPKDQIRVIVRVRPASSTEKQDLGSEVATKPLFNFINHQNCAIGTHEFSFDRVYPPGTTQDELFHTHFNEYVDNALDGFSSAIIAFGQTAAGKSFTMAGEAAPHLEGVIPRAVRRLFDNHAGNITASYVEIYNEKLLNLFDHKVAVTLLGDGTLKDTKTVQTSSASELLSCIQEGNSRRATGQTAMNSASSRSHAVLTLQLGNGAKLMLVDLAGSEIVRKTGASGRVLNEAGSINKSLTSLAMVISALSHKARPKHIPYRASKLTQILQGAFGGDSKTTLVINCSSLHEHMTETIASLRFGARAKLIQNLMPSKEERALCNTLTTLKLEIQDRVKCWKLSGPKAKSTWLEVDALFPLLGQPESTLSLASRMQSEWRELERLRKEITECEELRNNNLSKIKMDFDAAINARHITISKLTAEIDGLRSQAQEVSSANADSSPHVAELDRVSMAIDDQGDVNDKLRRDLARIRAQSTYEKAINHLKSLETEIHVCGEEIEQLSVVERPISVGLTRAKRLKLEIFESED